MATCVTYISCKFTVSNSNQLIELTHIHFLMYRYFEFSCNYRFWLRFWAYGIALIFKIIMLLVLDVVLTEQCDEIFGRVIKDRLDVGEELNSVTFIHTETSNPQFWYLCSIFLFTIYWKQWGQPAWGPVFPTTGECRHPRPCTEDEWRGRATGSWWDAIRVHTQ